MEDVYHMQKQCNEKNTIIYVDSSKRNRIKYPFPSEYSVDFQRPFLNVCGVDILDSSIPRTMYFVDHHTNKLSIIISEHQHTIYIPPGDYNSNEFINTLNNLLNQTPLRIYVERQSEPFSVSSKITFFSTAHPFIINMDDSTCGEIIGLDSKVLKVDIENELYTTVESQLKQFKSLQINTKYIFSYNNFFQNQHDDIILPIKENEIVAFKFSLESLDEFQYDIPITYEIHHISLLLQKTSSFHIDSNTSNVSIAIYSSIQSDENDANNIESPHNLILELPSQILSILDARTQLSHLPDVANAISSPHDEDIDMYVLAHCSIPHNLQILSRNTSYWITVRDPSVQDPENERLVVPCAYTYESQSISSNASPLQVHVGKKKEPIHHGHSSNPIIHTKYQHMPSSDSKTLATKLKCQVSFHSSEKEMLSSDAQK